MALVSPLARLSALGSERPSLATSLPTKMEKALSDTSESAIDCSLAAVAPLDSLEALKQVAAKQATQWITLSVERVKCNRQEQFADAMHVMTKRGFLPGMQWLVEEYFPAGKGVNLPDIAAERGHAEVLQWLFEEYPDERYISQPTLQAVVRNGFLDILRVLWDSNVLQRFRSPIINRNIVSTHLPVIQFLQQHVDNLDIQKAMKSASLHGKLDIMLWLYEHCSEPFTEDLFASAVAGGHLSLVQYLHTNHRAIVPVVSNEMMNVAAMNGDLLMLQWLHTNRTEPYYHHWGDDYELLSNWLHDKESNGYWDVAKWWYEQQYDCMPEYVAVAAVSGNLPMLQWLYDKYRKVFDDVTVDVFWLDRVSINGHFETIQWLDNHGYLFTSKAVLGAAKHGHLTVLRWLHQIHPELSADGAMDAAAEHGHFEIVQWLHENRTEGCRTWAMTSAAAINRLDIVQFLHENRTEGCTKYAMDITADVEILEFLHRNRNEGCTVQAWENAAASGNLPVLEWLYEHKRELGDLDLIRETAGAFSRYHVLYWVDAVEAEEAEEESYELGIR